MLQILCKTPAAIFKIQIPANTKSKFNRIVPFQIKDCSGICAAIPKEKFLGDGSSSVCQEAKERLSPVLMFIPIFMLGRKGIARMIKALP